MLDSTTPSPPSPPRGSEYSHSLNTRTAPIRLQTYQPQQPQTDDIEPTLQFSPPKRKNPLEWLFGFLTDGTTTVPATSTFLGKPSKTSVFRQRQPTGGLFSRTTPTASERIQPPEVSSKPKESSDTRHKSRSNLLPPWSTWKDWKKISLDFYIRLLDTPQYSRLRLKQTIAPLPIIKLKPVIDLAYRGPAKSPLTMHLDVKLLDCLKYRVHTDGSSLLQVRAKAPMSDPRFTMDLIYERQIGTALDSVKITFRALDVAFLKAPKPGFGCKVPIRFNNGVKSTIRVKKFIDQSSTNAPNSGNPYKYSRRRHPVNPKIRTSNQDRQGRQAVSGAGSTQHGAYAQTNRLGIFGPIGVDIKLRCLEYR